jgi:predicted phosphodiesterase
MRVAVLSDVHSNLHALEAVLADVDAGCFDALWFLGDLVG